MIKEILKDKKILIIIVLILGWFYWFQIRPAQIRKECLNIVRQESKESEKYSRAQATVRYRTCLIDRGMKPEDLIPSSLLN